MPPPLPPTAQGIALNARGATRVEMFLDLICPFSVRMLKAVDGMLASAAPNDVNFIVHHVPQPWHPQSTLVHEVALAVQLVDQSAYMPVVRKLMAAYESGKFHDTDTWEKSRAAIYTELVAIVSDAVGEATAAKVADMVKMKENGNNEMTQHIKWACKFHRSRGVHVTPTVHVNGIEAGIVSSGWTSEQWIAFLEPNGADCFQGSKLS